MAMPMDFVFIVIRVALTNIEVEAAAAALWLVAEIVTEWAKATGAAWTEWAERAAARIVPVETTPRFLKNDRSFSNARLTRFCAALGFKPRSRPTSSRGRCS